MGRERIARSKAISAVCSDLLLEEGPHPKDHRTGHISWHAALLSCLVGYGQ